MTQFQLVAAQDNDQEAVLLTPKGAYQCKVTINGIGDKEKDEDGLTPIGAFPIRQAFYRKDRLKDVKSAGLSLVPIAPDYGWCYEAGHEWYNRHVRLPFDGACDMLWREDGQYDLVLVIGYNDTPVIAGKGCVLFLYAAEDDETVFRNGISVSAKDLREILEQCTEESEILIQKP